MQSAGEMRWSDQTMQAAAIDHFGGEITPHRVPVPRVGGDEVLIRVEAAGVGVWDPFEREGGFAKWMGGKPKFPYTLGSDGAGTVVEVGEKVKRFGRWRWRTRRAGSTRNMWR